ALWTLEGLNALSAQLTREVLADPDPRVRIQGLRASESLYKAGDHSFDADYRRLASDGNTDAVIQAVLTMNLLNTPETSTAVKSAMDGNKTRGVQFVAERVLNPPGGGRGRGGAALNAEQQSSMDRGGSIYTEVCYACHW